MLRSCAEKPVRYTAAAISTRAKHSHQELCASRFPYFSSDAEIEACIASGDPWTKQAHTSSIPGFDPVHDSAAVASVMNIPLCHLERSLRRLTGPAAGCAYSCRAFFSTTSLSGGVCWLGNSDEEASCPFCFLRSRQQRRLHLRRRRRRPARRPTAFITPRSGYPQCIPQVPMRPAVRRYLDAWAQDTYTMYAMLAQPAGMPPMRPPRHRDVIGTALKEVPQNSLHAYQSRQRAGGLPGHVGDQPAGRDHARHQHESHP